MKRRDVDLLVIGDGASVHTRRHVEAMASSGMSVALAAFEGDPIAGVRSVSLGTMPPDRDLRYPLAIPTLARTMRRLRPRLIHAHYVSSYGLLTAAAMRLAYPMGNRPPLVISAWGADLLMTARSNRVWTIATAATLRSADVITSDSVDLDAEAKALAPRVERMQFVWGPPKALFEGSPPIGHQVVSARALVSHTRVDLVVRAFRAARASDPLLDDWRLAVVGNGANEAAVRAAADGDPAVVFLGRLTLEGVREVLQASRIFANVPASDATSAILLDSLAVGNLPVVNDLPAYHEWIDGDIGEVVPVDPSDAELAAAISRAARREVDPELIRDRVRAVSWPTQVQKLVDAYGSLIGPADTDASQIIATYERRGETIDPTRYSVERPGNALALEEREGVLGRALEQRGVSSLARLDILEVGCGTGNELGLFVAAGASPARLSGIDLREDAVMEARSRVPGAHLEVGDATSLPFPDGAFDLVYQATALSSMPSASMRSKVAAEMVRVTRPGGLIVSYDFAVNPTNRETVGIGARELRRLFAGLPLEVHRVTLAPPIARWLGDHSVRALHLAARISPLRTHRLAIVDVPADA